MRRGEGGKGGGGEGRESHDILFLSRAFGTCV